jgi:hypothetical protein
MPHIVIVIAALLAMLFNVVGVPGPGASGRASSNPGPDVVMMVLDQVKHRA